MIAVNRYVTILANNLTQMNKSVFLQISKKKRIHFNSFMTDVHARIHAVKEVESRNYQYVGSDKANPFDPTKPVAEMITADAWLICFDEFQVSSTFRILLHICKCIELVFFLYLQGR